jgi:hypothetical protein
MIGIAAEGLFGDRRLERRIQALLAAMLEKEQVKISSLSSSWASQMAYYRLLANAKVTPEKIIEGMRNYTKAVSEPKHYLLLQDTTQPNYEWNRHNIKPHSGLGVIGNKKDLGFFLHPALVVAANQSVCLGFAHVDYWSRSADAATKHQRLYKSLPIEEKESYRWLESLQKAEQVLDQAQMITSISDREGDIFELFALCDEKRQVVVRSRDDRKLCTEQPEQRSLYGLLSEQACAGVYQLDLKADIRKKKRARKALIEVRFAKAAIAPPKRLKQTHTAQKVYIVEAREVAAPQGEKPVHWRLITSHQVESFEQAVQVIYWYSQRWYIETLFRLLKNKGMQIEHCQLQNGESIIKMVMLSLISSLRIMLLLLASKGENNQQAESIFNEAEIACLQLLEKNHQGRTKKQQNPYEKLSMQWAAWIIARLGGWKGLQSQGDFGVITLAKGLSQFNLIFQGYQISKHTPYAPNMPPL